MIIRANYKKMNDSLKRLYDIATSVDAQIEKLVEEMENLQIFWDGYANEKYLIKFNTDMGHAEILLEKSKDTAVLMNRALERYQKCEQEIALLISEMPKC